MDRLRAGGAEIARAFGAGHITDPRYKTEEIEPSNIIPLARGKETGQLHVVAPSLSGIPGALVGGKIILGKDPLKGATPEQAEQASSDIFAAEGLGADVPLARGVAPKAAEVAEKPPTERPSVAAAPAPKPAVEAPPPPIGVMDSVRRLVDPETAIPRARAAGMLREMGARRAQSFDQAAAQLSEYGQQLMALPRDQRFDIVSAYQTGKAESIADPRMRQFTDDVHKLFEDRWQQMEQRGIDPKGYVENYFTQTWKNPLEAERVLPQIFGKGSLEGGKRFTKARTFASYREGMAAGLQPASENPIELALMGLQQMDKYITANDLVSELETTGIGKWMKPDEWRPPGFRPISDKIAHKLLVDETGNIKGSMTFVVPEQVAGIIDTTFSPGWAGKPWYQALRSAGNMMNMAQLGVSGFHARFVLFDAAVSKLGKALQQISRLKPGEVARGVGNIPRVMGALPEYYYRGAQLRRAFQGRPPGPITKTIDPIINSLRRRRDLNRFLREGTWGPDMERMVDAAVAGGARARMDTWYRGSQMGNLLQAMRGSVMRMRGQSGPMTVGQTIRQMFHEADTVRVRGVPVLPAQVRAAAQIVPRVFDTFMAPIFEDLVPKLKMGVIYDLGTDALRTNPNMTRDQLRAVMGKIADAVDDRLGMVVYDNMFMDRYARDIGHMAVRALGWNIGTLRQALRGIKEATTGRETTPSGTKQLGTNATYLVAMTILAATYGALYQYLKTGKPPDPKNGYRDYFFPQTGGRDAQGGPERANVPGYLKDYYDWMTATQQTAVNKIHPLWTTVYDMLENQQFNGAAIADTRKGVGPGQVKDYGKWLIEQFAPLSARTVLGLQPGQAGTNIGPGERFFGTMPAPYSVREPAKEEGYKRRVISQKVRKGQKTGTQYSQ